MLNGETFIRDLMELKVKIARLRELLHFREMVKNEEMTREKILEEVNERIMSELWEIVEVAESL